MEHDERYRRAREFYDVVTGLWDSFADDAFVRDQQSGIFFDPDKLHTLDHKGPYFSVRGPLNIARPVQGRPVIVQAGASDAGRQLAAETAEVVFAPARTIEDGRALYSDIHRRMRAIGRADDTLKILPAALVVVGASQEDAEGKLKLLDSLVHPDSSLPNLSMRLGVDASAFNLDETTSESAAK
jgi:alkanesulfonate monooxygenase